jgi:hypothetical protein
LISYFGFWYNRFRVSALNQTWFSSRILLPTLNQKHFRMFGNNFNMNKTCYLFDWLDLEPDITLNGLNVLYNLKWNTNLGSFEFARRWVPVTQQYWLIALWLRPWVKQSMFLPKNKRVITFFFFVTELFFLCVIKFCFNFRKYFDLYIHGKGFQHSFKTCRQRKPSQVAR